MLWGTPSSKILKSSFLRSVTRWPASSRTVTLRTTSSTLRLRVNPPWAPRSSVWAPRVGEPGCSGLTGSLSAASGERTGSRSTFSGGCVSGFCPEAVCVWLDGAGASPARALAAADFGVAAGGADAFCAASVSGAVKRRASLRTSAKKARLLQRRIVSGTGMDCELGQSGRRHQLHLQFTPLSVVLVVIGFVTENVFVPQFGTDLGRNVAHFGDVVDAEQASARFVADVVQQQRSHALLCGRRVRIEDSDGIDLHAGLTHHRTHLAFGIPAAIIAAVGHHQQRLALVLRLLHLVQTVIDGVQERGAVFSLDDGEAGFDLIDRRGKVLDQLGTIVEADDEEFILRIGGFHELQDGISGANHLVVHAAAQVEDYPDRYWRVFSRKRLDGLEMVVLVDEEVLFFESGHKAIHRISNGQRHQHQVHIDADLFPRPCRLQRCRAFGGRGLFTGLRWRWLHVDRAQRVFLRSGIGRSKDRTQQAEGGHCQQYQDELIAASVNQSADAGRYRGRAVSSYHCSFRVSCVKLSRIRTSTT